MANSYRAPGVYIEEVPSSMQTIAGVGTNTVGFIGIVDDNIPYPQFLTDDDYQNKLKEAQDKHYGQDADYSDGTIGGNLDKAGKDLDAAKNAVGDAAKKIAGLTKAVATAVGQQKALPDGSTDAAKEAAQTAVDNANKVLADAKAAAPTLDRDVEAAQRKLDDLTAISKFSPDQRIKAARASARDAARADVSRYSIESFAIKVPAGQAKLCTNFSEYQSRFGPWSAYPVDAVGATSSDNLPLTGHQVLTHGVYGFFNNGGTRCFVARVRKDNLAADLDLALKNFESVESISLVAFPGSSADAQISAALVAHCEQTKYRFAILDAPASPLDPQGALDLQQLTYDGANSLLPARTKHAATYFPYIEVVDPALQLQQSNLESIPSKYKGLVYVPPSGAVAGIYARTDVQRGVFKAPANASVLGALNVKYYLSRAHQEGLNPQGVNCIRTLNGNITLWGARTCGGDENSEWRYVNVRRTFLFIAKSIDEGTQWVVFEPNDPTLWGKVRRNVSDFLKTLWREGALFGTAPEEAFYVKCDAENNPPETREVGQLVIEVGVSIVRPAEFVIFRITQGNGNAAQ